MAFPPQINKIWITTHFLFSFSVSSMRFCFVLRLYLRHQWFIFWDQRVLGKMARLEQCRAELLNKLLLLRDTKWRHCSLHLISWASWNKVTSWKRGLVLLFRGSVDAGLCEPTAADLLCLYLCWPKSLLGTAVAVMRHLNLPPLWLEQYHNTEKLA